MDAGFLDVFHNAADVQLLAVEQRIDIDFDGILQELIDQQRGGQTARDHSIGLGLGKRAIHVLVELLVVINDFHAAATENVARAHQHRIADAMCGFLGLFEAQGSAVTRGIHLRLLKDLAEQLTVLGQVDGLRGGAENRHTGGLQTCGQRERGLATELDDNALDRAHLLLGLVDLEHVFEGERLKVEAVGHVVIGGHGFRVAVDHDGVIVLTELLHGVHARVVELDALTDAVRAGTQDDDRLALTRTKFGLIGVAAVVVRRGRIKLCGTGVDGLVDGLEAIVPAQFADGVLAFVAEAAKMGDLHVGQAGELRLLEQLRGQSLGLAHGLCSLVDEQQLLQEPRVDLGGRIQLIQRCATPDGTHELQVAVFGRRMNGLEQLSYLICGRLVAVPVEAHVTLVNGAHGLAEGLLEVAGQSHGLAHGLHGGGQGGVGTRELLECEARHLGDHVVDGRLEGGDADVTQLLVFAIGQGEARGHGDGVTGVHADRVDVFNRADDHDVVVAVAHELELEFLPAFDALFDQDFVGG